MKLKVGQHIHLVGIGGAGLSAIARILLGQGYKVSGSDRSLNSLTEALAQDGAIVYQGHDASYVNGADVLIITSAVKDDHVEVAAAREKGIPVYKRQDIIADLMEGKTVIAVAGTKGKTTTTSMIVHILRECGADPSYIVGGTLGNTGTNAGVGTGKIFVIEADEYDNMFHGLKPDVAIVTNMEYDHPDFFKTPEDMYLSFEHFVSLLPIRPNTGILIAQHDNAWVSRLIRFRKNQINQNRRRFVSFRTHIICYGVNRFDWPIHVSNIRVSPDGYTTFQLMNDNYEIGTFRLNLTGEHNVQNAAAAILGVGEIVKVAEGIFNVNLKIDSIMTALHSFKSTGRRFEIRGDVNQIAVVDDYAHNPMSIRAVLEAARQRYPGRVIWAVWQPHTFSRTQALMGDYIKAFDTADHVLITDIYAARENPIEGVTSATVVGAMKHPDVRHTATFEDTVQVLMDEVKSPAVILIMSAGDAPQIGIEYLKRRAVRD